MIRADTRPAEAWLGGLYRDQVPFAASRALNQTGRDVQRAEQGLLASNFILRQPQFILRSVMIPRMSHKHDPELAVEVVVGDKARFLRKFQEGGVKTALRRDEPIAIPSSFLRPSPSDQVPRALYPRNLRLVSRKGVTGTLPAQRHVTARGVVQLKGKRRTFVLDPTQHFGVRTWGVYQRIGPGRGDIRLLWIYRQQIRIPKRFPFRQTAETTVEQRWTENFSTAFAQSVRSAK